ncbi:MAG: hypothetical protein AAGA91_07675 [Pseudomonadota bacterium]
MQPFEFVMILVSIILALGVKELLAGVARMLRGELRPYWIHTLWIGILFVMQLQYSWTLFDLEAREKWVFLDLLRLLTPPITLFLVSSLLFPVRGQSDDLAEFYFTIRKPVFALLSGLMGYYTLLSFSPSILTAIQASSTVILASLVFTANKSVHKLVTPVYAAATLGFVATYSYTLGESVF